MSNPVVVRERQAADLARCVEILRIVHDRNGYPTRWPLDPSGWLSPPKLVGAWVADHDGDVVGHIGIYSPVDVPALTVAANRAPAELAAISRLFVDPTVRRGGIGQALLHVATDRAADLGCQPVLDVVESGTAAIALYERLGWRYITSEAATWTNAAGEHPQVRYYLGP